MILDFDATPITAHSDKELAAGHYKGGFGFNQLLATCGREVLLEARHRAHAIVEERVRELKSTGLANLPFSPFAANQAWLEAALCAHNLTVWTHLLLFDGEHKVCEPKRLRYRNADLAVMPTLI